MLSEYRERFGSYHSEMNREDFLYRSGRKEKCETALIRSEYSDLFTISAVRELKESLKDLADYRETERAGIKRLIAFAIGGHVAALVREVSVEIAAVESAARIDWDGQKIGLQQAAEALANEGEQVRRRDLAARRDDLIKSTQDLRVERFGLMHAEARRLDYQSYALMLAELRGIAYQSLAEAARVVLVKSESSYASALADLLARRLQISIDDAVAGDLYYLQRFTEFDRNFPRERLLESYRELCSSFGFRSEKQNNVEIVSAMSPVSESFCAPLAIPEEIKLVTSLSAGQYRFRDFFRRAGESQGYAWTSSQLHPEFRYPADRAVKASWGLLFSHLMLDSAWLQETFGFSENRSFRHVLAVLRLMAIRSAAARLEYELEYHSGKLPGNAGVRYAESLTEAVRVGFNETGHLHDLSDDFHPADYLRASALESQLREHLKSKFGLRWWRARKAGEMLIDLWNTGERYTAEELASMIGLGRLDFDWLAAELLGQLEK